MTIGALLGETGVGVGHIPRRLVDNIRNEKYKPLLSIHTISAV